MKRIFLAGLSVIAITIAGSMTAYAGEWRQDSKGWWYQADDGSYPASSWHLIDSDGDGLVENYYFDSNGYLLTDTITPDGFQVNEDGAWVYEGRLIVQLQSNALAAIDQPLPDMEISMEDITREYVRGLDDFSGFDIYLGGTYKSVVESLAEGGNLLQRDSKDISIAELRHLVENLESIDFSAYNNSDSLLLRKLKAADEWAVNIMLQYSKDMVLLYDRGISWENKRLVAFRLKDLFDKRNDLLNEVAELFEKVLAGEIRR